MLGTRGRLLRVAVLLVHAVVRVAGVHRLRGTARLRMQPHVPQCSASVGTSAKTLHCPKGVFLEGERACTQVRGWWSLRAALCAMARFQSAAMRAQKTHVCACGDTNALSATASLDCRH